MMLRIVGIDIGSVALSVVVVDEKGAMINSFY
jgi:activator of 2-hydroxyglutaryl-CoA dehydratase